MISSTIQSPDSKQQWLNEELMKLGRFFDLSSRELDNLDAIIISLYLYQCKDKLKVFHIGGNQFDDRGLIDILQGLQWHLGLKEIYIGNNQFSEVGIEAFVGMLGMFSRLEILSLANSGMNDENFIQLCYQLEDLKEIRQVSVPSNQVSDIGIICLSSLITTQSIPGLRVFHLGDNPITQYGLNIFFQALQIDKTLKMIYLNDIAIDMASIRSLALCLRKNSSLKELNLGNTGFSDQAAQIIWDVIPYSSLQGLQLWGNHLTDESLRYLLDILEENTTNLEYIGLTQNQNIDEELLIAINAALKQNQMINSLPDRIKIYNEEEKVNEQTFQNETPFISENADCSESEDELEMLDEEFEGTKNLESSIIKKEKDMIKNDNYEEDIEPEIENPLQGQLKIMKWTGEQNDSDDYNFIHSKLR